MAMQQAGFSHTGVVWWRAWRWLAGQPGVAAPMRVALRLVIAVLLLAMLTDAPPALAAGKRVALVIGNGAYARVPGLANPANDAAAMATLLERAGFEVTPANDLGEKAMKRALRDFADTVRDADIAVVFYAGHGLEMDGVNYLVPVDAVLERDLDVKDETVPLDRIAEVLEPAKRLRLIILDACRDNPFVRTMKRTLAGRSIGRGLAKVEVVSSDTLVADAAKAGSTAADGTGANSPYTAALIQHLTTPGLDVRLALGRVRDDVLRATRNAQEPFVYGSLGGSEIALVPTAAVATPTSPPPGPTLSGLAAEAAALWPQVMRSTDIEEVETFARRYGETYHGDLARNRVAA